MKKIRILFLFFVISSIFHVVNSQILIDKNNLDFWGPYEVAGKYYLKILEPERFNLKIYQQEVTDRNGETSKVGRITLQGTKSYDVPGYGKVDFNLYIEAPNSYSKGSKNFNASGDVDINAKQDCSGGRVDICQFYQMLICDGWEFEIRANFGPSPEMITKINETGYGNDMQAVWERYKNTQESFYKTNIEGDLEDFIKNNIKIIPADANVDEIVDKETDAKPVNWKKVVGGAAALAVAVAAASVLLRRRRNAKEKMKNKASDNKDKSKQKNEEKKEKNEYFYLLQLNKEVVDLSTKDTDTLLITAWRVDELGGKDIANEAEIILFSDEKSLIISPSSGKGQCKATFSLAAKPKDDVIEIKIKANAKGKVLLATAKVDCGSYKLIADSEIPLTIINGKRYFEAQYIKNPKDENGGEWKFKPIYLWFTDNIDILSPERSKPVNPPFVPNFVFEAKPAILVFNNPVVHGDNVWKVEIGLNKNVPIDQKWLFNNGQIEINISATKKV